MVEVICISISLPIFTFYNSKAHWSSLASENFFLHADFLYLDSDLHEHYFVKGEL